MYLGTMSMTYDGFALGPNDTLYGLTSAYITNGYNSYLFVIGPNYGLHPYETLSFGTPLYLSGNRWYCLGEGDLAFDNTGVLYATCKAGSAWQLITINPGSGAVAIKGTMPAGGAFSALAFNKLGELFALDTSTRTLWKVNKNNPSSNPQSIPLIVGPGQIMPNTSLQGAMGFSTGGGLYAFFGGQLVSINLQNGMLTILTNNNFGYISGMVVSGGVGAFPHQ